MRNRATDPTFDGVGLAPSPKYPAIITPQLTLESVLTAVNNLKEVVEILIRLRGKTEDSAFTVADADRIITRLNQVIKTTYATKEELEASKGDRLLGMYDQTTDTVSTGGALLPASDPSIQDRDYYILEANGAFITTHPDLAGETGGIADTIIAANGVWNHVNVSSAYLSAVIDDTAEGHITLNKVPTATVHAARLQQVNAVQSNLDTHVGHTTATNDVHGSKTYTDQEITDLATAILENFAVAAYGGLTLDTPDTGNSLGAGWQALPFNAGAVTAPRDITQNPANNSISIQEVGKYFVSVSTSFTQNDSNQGRITYLRFWNITDGNTDGQEFPVGIGRNSPAASATWTFLTDIDVTLLNKEFRIEIGGGSSVSGVDFLVNEFTIFHVSEYTGVLV